MTSLAVMLSDGTWAAYTSVASYELRDGTLVVVVQRTPTWQDPQTLRNVVGLLIGEPETEHVPGPRTPWDGKTIAPGTICDAIVFTDGDAPKQRESFHAQLGPVSPESPVRYCQHGGFAAGERCPQCDPLRR